MYNTRNSQIPHGVQNLMRISFTDKNQKQLSITVDDPHASLILPNRENDLNL